MRTVEILSSAVFLFFIYSCQNYSKNQSVYNPEKITIAGGDSIKHAETDYSIKESLTVEYSDIPEPDTMYITLQNHKMMITPTGQIFDGDSIFIDLLVDEDYLIEKLFIITTEEYLIAIYTDVNGSSTGSTAKKIMFQDNEVIWNVNIGGFNMATPVYDNKYLYLSSIGNICKLNFDTGEFDWKFENLYNNGKYNSFNKPEFLDNNMILFTSIREDDSGRIDSIIVDDLIKNIVVRK